MNFKTTVALLLLVAIVGVFFLLSRDKPGTHEMRQARSSQRDEGRSLFTAEQLATDEITAVRIERADQPAIVIERDGNDWVQTQPVRFAIGKWHGDQLADRFASLRQTGRFQPGDRDEPSLNEIGLEPPQAVVTVTLDPREGQSPRTLSLHVGRTIGGTGFAMVNDDPNVYRIDRGAHDTFVAAEVNTWRRRSPEGPTEGQAQTMTLRHADYTITLTKVEDRWSLDPVRGERADREAVRSILSTLNGLYVDEFVADGPADLSIYGLDQPNLEAVVTWGDAGAGHTPTEDDDARPQPLAATGRQLRLLVGGPTDLSQEKRFATWMRGDGPPQVIFTLNESSLASLRKAPDELRDRRITVARSSDVTQLQITRDSLPMMHLLRGGDGWSFAEPGPGYRADGSAVLDLLNIIMDAQGVTFDPSPQRGDEPAATITMHVIGRSDQEVVNLFGPHEDDDGARHYVAVRGGEQIGYRIPSDDLRKLFEPLISLRDRLVLDLQPEQVRRLTVQRGSDTFTFERQPAEAGDDENAPSAVWSLQGHERFERDALDTALNHLAPLRAERWVTAATDDEPGDLVVTLTTDDGGDHTLRIDRGTRDALLSGIDARFRVRQRLIEALDAEFRHRTVLRYSLDQIERVTITREGHSLTLQRGATGRYLSPDGQSIIQSAAGGLFDTLSGLRATRFVEMPSPMSETLHLHLIADGQSHILRLDEDDVAVLDDRAFTLPPETVDKLRAKLVQQQQ